jgi:hypothetical protein
MKYMPNRLFGYPVLRDEPLSDADYPNKKIKVDIKLDLHSEDFTKYTVKYELALDSGTLNNLLEEEKIEFVVRISCNPSLFSYSEICSGKGSFDVEGDKLRDKVEISAFLVANQTFTLKSLSGEFHTDFGTNEFVIEHGMVVAYPSPVRYFISKDNFKTITSIFKYSGTPNHERDTFTVDLNDQVIQIVALDSQISLFRALQIESKDIAINALFVPALAQAIETLKQSRADYDDHRWANVILTKCQSLGIDIEDERFNALDIAQRLFRSPIKLLNSRLTDTGD